MIRVAGLKTCIAYCSLYLQHKIVHSITSPITFIICHDLCDMDPKKSLRSAAKELSYDDICYKFFRLQMQYISTLMY